LEHEVAVIGERETVIGFSLAGVKYAHIHSDRSETLSKLSEFLSSERMGVIMITYRVREELGEEFEKLVAGKDPIPVVLSIPDRTGYVPPVDELMRMVERTVGAKIVIKEEET